MTDTTFVPIKRDTDAVFINENGTGITMPIVGHAVFKDKNLMLVANPIVQTVTGKWTEVYNVDFTVPPDVNPHAYYETIDEEDMEEFIEDYKP